MREHNQPAILFLREGRDDLFDLGGIAHIARRGLDRQSLCCVLDRSPLGLTRGVLKLHDREDSGNLGCSLLERLKPLATQ